jgi:hypothetical protein
MPTTIRRSDKAECGGSRSTAEDIGVVSRIDPAQTARDHGPAKLAAVTAAVHIIRDRRGKFGGTYAQDPQRKEAEMQKLRRERHSQEKRQGREVSEMPRDWHRAEMTKLAAKPPATPAARRPSASTSIAGIILRCREPPQRAMTGREQMQR